MKMGLPKYLFKLFLLAILFFACREKKPVVVENQDPVHVDSLQNQVKDVAENNKHWQQSFGLTHDPSIDSIAGKPVKYYIDNPACSQIAIKFYKEEYRPTDDDTTAALLVLVTTDNNSLRPFYRWCLDKTIEIEDGALAEYTGVPARDYAQKFPNEFFAFVDRDTTGIRYSNWIGSISYSGYYEHEDYRKPGEIRKRIISKMKQHCDNCSPQIMKRIEEFAADCYKTGND